VHGFGSGRCRQSGSHSTDGCKIEMPAFDRVHEAALVQPMLPQSEVESLSLRTETTRQAGERALDNLGRLVRLLLFRGCVRRAIAAFAHSCHTVCSREAREVQREDQESRSLSAE
jgi:hypothetical protein